MHEVLVGDGVAAVPGKFAAVVREHALQMLASIAGLLQISPHAARRIMLGHAWLDGTPWWRRGTSWAA